MSEIEKKLKESENARIKAENKLKDAEIIINNLQAKASPTVPKKREYERSGKTVDVQLLSERQVAFHCEDVSYMRINKNDSKTFTVPIEVYNAHKVELKKVS